MSGKALFIPDLIPASIALAREAGALIMQHYQGGGVVSRKDDASPVTEADRAADRLIVAGLASLIPGCPVVSEEGEKPDVAKAEYFWLVDPLDGTKSFIRGSGYFTVNIALVDRSRVPVLGVIYDPVHKVMYWGGQGKAMRDGTEIHCRAKPAQGLTAIISHSHINQATEDYLAMQPIAERIPCASSIKFCWLAEGRADIYPRFGPTSEWDTAAGHAILIAAGGSVTMPEGTPFLYGKAGFRNGHFVARGW
jgi:3'(2'), 5'-bisphosphate nucleotidase